MRSQATDDYIKAIYELSGGDGVTFISTGALAEELQVSAASVTGMLKRLARDGQVIYRPYRGARLSTNGMRLALHVVRSHSIIEMYLHQELDIPWERTHDEAEKWEHVISPEVMEKMAQRVGNPEVGPDGKPIPGPGSEFGCEGGRCLMRAPAGDMYVVCSVDSTEPSVAKYLRELGIVEGARVTVISHNRVDRLTLVRVGDAEVILGARTASRVQLTRSMGD